MQFELLLMFESVTHTYLSSTFSSVTSLTCLNKHGFINFSLVVLILHAVKCQATSKDRYVSMNPIATYARPNIGSISIIAKYRAQLIKKLKH